MASITVSRGARPDQVADCFCSVGSAPIIRPPEQMPSFLAESDLRNRAVERPRKASSVLAMQELSAPIEVEQARSRGRSGARAALVHDPSRRDA